MTKAYIQSGALFDAAERGAKLLLVDDDAANLKLLVAILTRAGFHNLSTATNGATAFEAFVTIEPDVTLLDLHLPDVTGTELIERLRATIPADDFRPILVLTGDGSHEARDEALIAGAKEFITKPYESTEVLLRLRNLLETRMLHLELREQRELLRARFEQRSAELEDARLEILERLARVAEHRDDGAYGHIRRVGELSGLIALELGWSYDDAEQIRRAAPLHDVGKIGIRDDILLKPGPLGPQEFQQQERHTIIGGRILSGGLFPVLRLAEEIALTHHERWDGKGYPHQLAGDDIPLSGRIVAVADSFDALTQPRPYKAAWPIDEAITEIQVNSGRRYDPAVVDALLRVVAQGHAARIVEAGRNSASEADLYRMTA